MFVGEDFNVSYIEKLDKHLLPQEEVIKQEMKDISMTRRKSCTVSVLSAFQLSLATKNF